MNNVAFAFWVVNISGSVFRWWWMSLFFNLPVVNISAFAFWLVDWFEHLCLSMLIFVYHMFWCEHLCLSHVLMWRSLFITGFDVNIFVYHRSLLSRFPEEARIAHQCLRQSVVVIIIKNIRISNNHFPPHFYHHHHHINFFLLITTTIGNASVISVSCCLLGPNWSDQYQHSLTVF